MTRRAPTVYRLESDEVFGFMSELGAVREQRNRLRAAALAVLDAHDQGRDPGQALAALRRVVSERRA